MRWGGEGGEEIEGREEEGGKEGKKEEEEVSIKEWQS